MWIIIGTIAMVCLGAVICMPDKMPWHKEEKKKDRWWEE